MMISILRVILYKFPDYTNKQIFEVIKLKEITTNTIELILELDSKPAGRLILNKDSSVYFNEIGERIDINGLAMFQGWMRLPDGV